MGALPIKSLRACVAEGEAKLQGRGRMELLWEPLGAASTAHSGAGFQPRRRRGFLLGRLDFCSALTHLVGLITSVATESQEGNRWTKTFDIWEDDKCHCDPLSEGHEKIISMCPTCSAAAWRISHWHFQKVREWLSEWNKMFHTIFPKEELDNKGVI